MEGAGKKMEKIVVCGKCTVWLGDGERGCVEGKEENKRKEDKEIRNF